MACWLWPSQKFNSHFADFGQVKKLVTLVFTGSLTRNQMLRQPLLFDWLPKHPPPFPNTVS